MKSERRIAALLAACVAWSWCADPASGLVVTRAGARSADGSPAYVPTSGHLAGIFVINLDERSAVYQGFLAHTAQILGVPDFAIVRSPGVYADDRVLGQPWVREVLPGLAKDLKHRRGALGVSLAHFLVWRNVAATPICQQNEDAYALIFEDDERIRDSFAWTVQSIEELALKTRPGPDLILLNALRPQGAKVADLGPVRLLAAGPHAEAGKRPNVWTSAYLVRCGSTAKLYEAFRGMRYNGTSWDGVYPQFDVVLQDIFGRPENKLREWVVSPSQAISFHSEQISIKRAIDKMSYR